MRVIRKAIWQIYSRHAAYWGMMLVLTAALCLIPLVISAGDSFIGLMEEALSCNVLILFVFSFLTYELGTQLVDDPDEEALRAVPGVRGKTAAACLLLLGLLLAGTCLLEYAGFCLRAVLLGVAYSELLIHMLKAVILYAFLPGLIGIACGSAFSGESRGLSYLLIVLISLLLSPPLTNMLPDGPIGILTRLDEWVRIFPAVDRTQVDAVYGLPVEPSRLALALFWIFLPLGLRCLRKETRSSLLGKCLLGGCFLLTVLCGFRFHHRLRDSVFDPVSAHGMYFEEELFYDTWDIAEQAVDFSVESYEMDLQVTSRLKAEVVVYLPKEDLAWQEYLFTLHHGLEVISVEDESGEPVPFRRDGDWLDLMPSRETDLFVVKYSGHIARHYSNSQGIFLPGYVAYYPIPGYIPLWNRADHCLQPVVNEKSTWFSVRVEGTKNLYTNLEQTNTKTWEGYAAAPTLIIGFIAERMDGDLTVYYPHIQVEPPEYHASDLEEACNEMAALLNTPAWDLRELRTVFVMPAAVSLMSSKEECVFFSDYFLHANPYPVIYYQSLARSLVMTPVRERDDLQWRMLRRLFSRALGEQDTAEPPQEKTAYEKVLPLIQYEEGRGTPNAYELIGAQEEFCALFYYQMDRLGREKFLPAVYEYLCSDGGAQCPVDFLYRLDEERGGVIEMKCRGEAQKEKSGKEGRLTC